eukprot:3808983-Pleurochrysis_carterae.AAC.2
MLVGRRWRRGWICCGFRRWQDGLARRGRGAVDGGAGCVVAVGAAPSESEARGRRDAIARAMIRLRSGGNAEEDADVHAPLDRTPPHCRV